MKKVASPLLALTVGFLLLANAHAQVERSVPIVNASFESPTVEEGKTSKSVPGWQWNGLPNTVSVVVHPGGASEREPWPSTPPIGMDGNNFCKLYALANGGGGVLYQDTGIKYQAGATYKLTAAFGLQTDTMIASNCTMFVGNSSLTQLASVTIVASNLVAGEFKDQTVTYRATGSEAVGDGTYGAPGDVIIGVSMPPSPFNTYLSFDNVRLKAPQAARPAPSPRPELANAHAQVAKSVAIVNASFESPAVEEGSFSGGTPGWRWLGWRAASSIVHPGGPSSAEPWPSTPPFGMDGNNFCQLFAYDNGGNGVVYQDTGIKYQAGVTYTLTAAFGLQTNAGQRCATDGRIFFDNSGLGESIAWTTISEANLTSGEFKDQTVSYTATGSEAPGDGTYGTPGDVIIGFWLPNSPPQTYMDVDHVRLKVTPSAHPVRSAPSAAPAASPSVTPNYFGTHM